MVLRFPYKINEPVKFQLYNDVLTRLSKFSTLKVIGKDQSGTYDMHSIELGNPIKPTFLIISCMHPPEQAAMQYTLKFMEMLRDNTFPDKAFRAKLLQQFHIVYVPITNPWGYAQLTDPMVKETPFRFNVNGVELNDDFYNFTQQESINIKVLVESEKPFMFLDTHMFSSGMSSANGKNLIIGNGQYATSRIQDRIARSWSLYSGEGVQQWDPFWTEPSGLAREFVRDQPNPHTPHTLSYITELIRPNHEVPNTPLSDIERMNNGIASLYFFFKTSMDYFHKRTQ